MAVKTNDFEPGDIIVFQYNNKILIKRYIAGPGDWVNIEEDGTVYVNGEALDEPYLTEKAFGECDLELPYQIPESRYFVMGGQPERVGGLPQYGGGLCGRGADRREDRILRLAV